jgi:hypothetical protein
MASIFGSPDLANQSGRDYVTEDRSPKLGSGNRGAAIEYHLSLDMAKEIAHRRIDLLGAPHRLPERSFGYAGFCRRIGCKGTGGRICRETKGPLFPFALGRSGFCLWSPPLVDFLTFDQVFAALKLGEIGPVRRKIKAAVGP